MEIKYTTGCTCESLLIDDKESIDMTTQEIRDVITKLLSTTKDLGLMQNIIINIVENQGDWESLGRCDECGDTIEKWTLKV